MVKDFELIEHTADLKIRVYGTTRQELFKHALMGMFHSVQPQSSECQYKAERFICSRFSVHRSIGVASADEIALLVDFLSTALYLSA